MLRMEIALSVGGAGLRPVLRRLNRSREFKLGPRRRRIGCSKSEQDDSEMRDKRDRAGRENQHEISGDRAKEDSALLFKDRSVAVTAELEQTDYDSAETGKKKPETDKTVLHADPQISVYDVDNPLALHHMGKIFTFPKIGVAEERTVGDLVH